MQKTRRILICVRLSSAWPCNWLKATAEKSRRWWQQDLVPLSASSTASPRSSLSCHAVLCLQAWHWTYPQTRLGVPRSTTPLRPGAKDAHGPPPATLPAPHLQAPRPCRRMVGPARPKAPHRRPARHRLDQPLLKRMTVQSLVGAVQNLIFITPCGGSSSLIPSYIEAHPRQKLTKDL
jgi:hypothetical protein